MTIQEAKQVLDKVINKSRVHLYKPIQIAEVLYRDRVEKDITLNELETYRKDSKKWRDIICLKFLGRISASSARYQDDLFNDNAIPPYVLEVLGHENRDKNGIVEAYIYKRFVNRFLQMTNALDYSIIHDKTSFQLSEFIDLFRSEPGLKRRIDKIYEIIVYSLFSALVEALELSVEVSYNPSKANIQREGIAIYTLNLDSLNPKYRNGVIFTAVSIINYVVMQLIVHLLQIILNILDIK